MLRLRRVTEETQRSFHETVLDGYRAAAAAAGEISGDYLVAGARIRLRFAGDALVPRIAPALAHLRAGTDGEADFQVCLWDSASTGVAMPAPPCHPRNFSSRGEIWGFTSERWLSAYHYIESSVNVFDTESGTAGYWVPDAAGLPFWVHASPLRTILHWCLRRRGLQLIHAAAVGTPEGAVLLPGAGGSGKSTLALACLRAGMHYLSDDYAVVGLDPEPRVHSLYCTAKLELDNLRRFPELAANAQVMRSAGYEKAVIFLDRVHPERLARELPLRAVLLPRVTGRPATSFAPVDTLALEQAARFTTMSQLPHTGRRTVAFMTRLAAEPPHAALRLGTRLDRIPAAVARGIRGSGGFRSASRRGRGGAAAAGLPLISVIIPVHNGARFVHEAVASVLAQRYPRTELILVNDGSTDDTRAALESLSCEHACYEFEENLGPAEARNRGLREAAGELVAFLDVDDLWPRGNLRRLADILVRQPEVDVVKGMAQPMEYDPLTGCYRRTGSSRKAFPYYIGSALYRRSAFLRVGPFDRSMRFGEDSDWFHRAFETGVSVLRLPRVTLHVRRHGNNMTWGKTLVELNSVLIVKHMLDRRRERGEV